MQGERRKVEFARGQVVGLMRHVPSPAVIKKELSFGGPLGFGCEFWLLGRLEEIGPRGGLDELGGCDTSGFDGELLGLKECLDELEMLEGGHRGFFDKHSECDDIGAGGVKIGLDFGRVGGSW